LQVRSVVVPLRVPEITEATAERARETLAHATDSTRAGFMDLVRARRAIELFERDGRPFDAEVQVISLGADLAWVGLPGELFVELGLALKKRSPFPHTLVVSLANGNPGYIPDRRSYAEGNYEPESSRVVPGSGEALVDAAARLLGELHPLPSP
jgi:neutral ceramidase